MIFGRRRFLGGKGGKNGECEIRLEGRRGERAIWAASVSGRSDILCIYLFSFLSVCTSIRVVSRSASKNNASL